MHLHQSICVVTGTAPGIVLALAEQLLAEGARVIAWDTAACRATNRPEAAEVVKMPRSAGWELG